MSLLEQTKNLCNVYDIKPARSKGQNFLIKEAVYDKIVEVSDLQKDDLVIEVGPGLGFLTAKLAQAAQKVVAIELDDKLAAILKTALVSQGVENVEVLNKNVLDLFFSEKSKQEQLKYKIVANLPYNITSVFLRKFLSEEQAKPELMVLMLQKEVAERIIAKPGEMSLLAFSVQYYADAEIIQNVPAEDFWPAPKVDSAIIRVRLKNHSSRRPPFLVKKEIKSSPLKGTEGLNFEKNLFRLVKFGFSSKRKMLKNNLAGGYHLNQAEAAERIKKTGFDEKVRAQELSVDDWIRLLQYFN